MSWSKTVIQGLTVAVLTLGIIVVAYPATSSDTPHSNPCGPGHPCYVSLNLAYDASAASKETDYVFQQVPKDLRVRVTRVYGDCAAWAHGRTLPDTVAQVSLEMSTTSPSDSPLIAHSLALMGSFLHIQQGVGSAPVRAPFDFSNLGHVILNEDNTLVVRQTVQLNETGTTVHTSTTAVVEFYYAL